jgi:hypothetical protein
MPEICRFFGIIISLNYNDHAPPHFHVRYGDQKALIAIDPLLVLEGRLSPRTFGLVMEWAALHQTELIDNWNLAKNLQVPKHIEPLK